MTAQSDRPFAPSRPARNAHRTHLPIRDATVPADHKGRHYCTCGALEPNPIHHTPDTAEAAAQDRRRLGEREEP